MSRTTSMALRDAAGVAKIVYKCPECKKIVCGENPETGNYITEIRKVYEVTESTNIDLKTTIFRTIEDQTANIGEVDVSLMSDRELLKKVKEVTEEIDAHEETGDFDSGESNFVNYECCLCGHEIKDLDELIVKIVKKDMKPNNERIKELLGTELEKPNNNKKEVDVDFGDIKTPGRSNKLINRRWGRGGEQEYPTGGIICKCGNEIVIGNRDVQTEVECPICGEVIKEDVITMIAN